MDGFERFEELFVGQDPLELERHVSVLETIAFHAGRYWPLEAALWDLAGKAAGVPVSRLLGGTLERVAVYASTGILHRPSDGPSRRSVSDGGVPCVKLRIARDRVEEGIATVAAVREAVEPDVAIMVDLNQGWRMPGDDEPLLAYETVSRGRPARRARRHVARGAARLATTSPGSPVCGRRAAC